MRKHPSKLKVRSIKKLGTLLAKDANILLAFLFGSHARGEAHPLSDVDIALLLSSDVPPEKFLDYRLEYAHAIGEILGNEQIDIVILNTAPPLLARQAITGRLLFERSPEVRVRYIVDVQRRYLDLKSFYAIDAAYLRQRLKEGTFGQP